MILVKVLRSEASTACLQLLLSGLGIDITLMVLFSGGMTSINNIYYITLVVMCAFS